MRFIPIIDNFLQVQLLISQVRLAFLQHHLQRSMLDSFPDNQRKRADQIWWSLHDQNADTDHEPSNHEWKHVKATLEITFDLPCDPNKY